MSVNHYHTLRYLEEGGRIGGVDFFDFFVFLVLWSASVRTAKIFHEGDFGGYVLIALLCVISTLFVADRKITKTAWKGWMFHWMTYNQRIHPHNSFSLEPMPDTIIELLNKDHKHE